MPRRGRPSLEQLLSDGLDVRRVDRVEALQTPWSGYGVVERIALDGDPARTAIVKHIRLGQLKAGRRTASHRRGLYPVARDDFERFLKGWLALR